MSNNPLPREGSLPVKYVLFSHYFAQEEDDFKAYKSKENSAPPPVFDGIKHLERHFRGLRELLTTPGHEGLLLLFYGRGFSDFMQELAASDSKKETEEDLLEKSASIDLRFAKEFAGQARKSLKEARLADRVRFITSLDLLDILGRVNERDRGKFWKYIVGAAKGLRYDIPKIPEAILRLRLLGYGIPVLRFDHDVIFREDNIDAKGIGDLGLFKAVACAVRAYRLRLEEPSISTFMFSASYDSRALRDPTLASDKRFEAWSRAFATRVYPALTVDLDKIRKIADMPEKGKNEKEDEELKQKKNEAWGRYANANLTDELVRAYYGLDGKAFKVIPGQGLTKTGAHPLYGVTSGALLCISEGGILDLPPFSNFTHNVMWIDDHLKYALHREMGHFTSREEWKQREPGLSEARLDDVMVTKERPSVSNLPGYTLGSYLPTLLLGTIMDAWITPNPLSKIRFAELKAAEQALIENENALPTTGVLPKALLEALREGSFTDPKKEKLRSDLRQLAVKRIEEVRLTWMGLQQAGTRTFASYWAEGEVEGIFPASCFAGPEGKKDEVNLWKGIRNRSADASPIKDCSQLNRGLHLKLEELIGDAVDYVEWTLEWPRFVQIVRSIKRGTFPGDMEVPGE